MPALKFPYILHCPKCKAKLKIKSPDLLGKRLPCPKCKAKVDVVTPDEDGYVPYGVEEAPAPEKPKELSEEELEEIHLAKEKERKKVRRAKFFHVVSIFFYLAILCGIGWGLWEYVFKGYDDKVKAKEKSRSKDDEGSAFGKLFKTD